MTAIYNTTRGATDDPLPVELWYFGGSRPYARMNRPGDIRLTWNDRSTGTSEYDVPLNKQTSELLRCDGTVLLVANLNGIRHVSTPFVAKSYNDGDTDEVRVKVTGGSPYSMFDGQLIWRAPGQPLALQDDYSGANYEGTLEYVVKNIIGAAAKYAQHPMYVRDVRNNGVGDGPQTKVVYSDFETVSDALDDLLTGTGYRVDVDVWLPGDPDPDGFDATGLSLTKPTVLVDVVPYRDNDGLIFSHTGGDLTSWSVEVTRRSASTAVIRHVDADDVESFSALTSSEPLVSPWHARHVFVETKDENDTPAAAGIRELTKRGRAITVEATVSPGVSWEYGNDGGYPRQYQIGDYATLSLGSQVGDVRQVVTEVIAELTSDGFTVTPKVSTPDTLKTDLYSTVADIDKRLTRQERRTR